MDRRERQGVEPPPERGLPASNEAERSVLGAILVHNDAYEAVGTLLTPQAFYRDAHRRIWTAMARLLDHAIGVDFVTLTEELRRTGDLDDVGGPAYLSSLADGMPRSVNAKQYVEIVREKARLRDVIFTANRMLSDAYEAQDSAEDLIARADRALLALRGSNGHALQTLADTAAERFQVLEWRVEHRGELRGIDTGFSGSAEWPSINELTLGLRAGHLIVLAARPSIGKTSLALNIAVNTARQGTRVAIFSLEMAREELDDRILSQLSGIPSSRIQGGFISEVEWPTLAQVLETMHALPIHIDDRPGQTAPDIRSRCRRLVSEYGGVGLVIIDYVQLMPGTLDRRGANRNEEITDISTRLKDMAKELSVPVMLLSQLRRLDGRPKIEDLRESGSLEQSADEVCLLHRKDHRVSGATEFILAKQRNGATGTVMLNFERETTTFTPSGEAVTEPPDEEKEHETKRRQQRMFARRRSS